MSGKFKKFSILTGAVLAGLGAASAQADSVFGLYNTGVGANGVSVAAGSVDSHYALLAPNPDDPTGVSADSAYVTQLNPFPAPYWVANQTSPEDSQWISPQVNYSTGQPIDQGGDYTYQTTFTASGPSVTDITGLIAVDDSLVSIYLNGYNISSDILSTAADNNISGSFYLPGADFINGKNTLDFQVHNITQNAGNPTGLQVNFGPSSADISTAVPLPASAGVGFSMLAGFGLLAGVRRKFGSRSRIA